MKSIEKNISQHENGTFYLRVRRKGKLIVKSLKTKDLKEARRKIESEGIDNLSRRETARESLATPSVPLLGNEGSTGMKGVMNEVTLKEAMQRHMDGVACGTRGTRRALMRCGQKAVAYAKDWAGFDCLMIWRAYRESGLGRKGNLAGKELGSSANHMKWYLGKFTPWAIKEGYLPSSAMDSLKKIKKVKVNPRRIRVPSVEVVTEFLAMIESEDPEGAAFLRFLGSTGLRITGARSLRWQDIDLAGASMVAMMKGGREKVLPLTPEAHAVLLTRVGQEKPWGFDNATISRLATRMKRFAKGFDVDLNYFHAFRHYFASRCLLAGLTVQEVAELLGHNDNGKLVLDTYGHLCREHLRTAVAGLRLVS